MHNNYKNTKIPLTTMPSLSKTLVSVSNSCGIMFKISIVSGSGLDGFGPPPVHVIDLLTCDMFFLASSFMVLHCCFTSDKLLSRLFNSLNLKIFCFNHAKNTKNIKQTAYNVVFYKPFCYCLPSNGLTFICICIRIFVF